MTEVENGKLFPVSVLSDWTRKMFVKVGVSGKDAALLTESLIEANLRGVDTHGITRMLPNYIKKLQSGLMNPVSKLEIVCEMPSTALIDCHNSIGQIGADFAMHVTIEKAKSTGAAFVATSHTNHYGASAYWTMMALEHDMIAFSCTNASPNVAPTGGQEPIFGANPFAVAIPAGKYRPFVLDMATTVVAKGRLFMHAKKGIPLEPGWAFDEMGNPTTDPLAGLKGLLAPIAGYKGYGMSFAIDIMSGVLTGSNFGKHVPNAMAPDLKEPSNLGATFMAFRIDSFMDVTEFKDRMDRAIRDVVTSKRAAGVDRIYIPGEKEFLIKEERLQKGIPVLDEVIKDFEALGAQVGVPFPA